MISKELQQFIDEAVDDEEIHSQLISLVSKVGMIEEGHKGLDATRRAEAYDRMVAGYDKAIRNQRDSINRLLEERRQHLAEIAGLRRELDVWVEANTKTKVGPE